MRITTRRLAGLAGLAVMLSVVYFVAYGAVISCPATPACVGTNLSDIITDNSGTAQTIYGLGGDDTITSADDGNTILAGPGNDSITTSSTTADTIFGEDGNDTILVPGGAAHKIYGGRGNDNIAITSALADGAFISDGPGRDVITASTGINSTTIQLAGDNETDLVSLNDVAANKVVFIILNINSGRDVIDCGGNTGTAIVMLGGNFKAVDPAGNNLRQQALLGGVGATNCDLIIP